jgi:hypothetical protein
MAETTEENSLEDIKEKINEVLELLNEPNLLVAVHEENIEADEPDAAKK